MTRHAMICWGLALGVVAAAGVWTASQHFQFLPGGFAQPLAIAGAFGGVGFYYRRRQEDRFVLCAVTLTQVIFFTVGYTTLMYLAGAIGRPLIDRSLVQADAWLGFHLPALLAWQAKHPAVGRLLQLSYDSMVLQTGAVVCLLGLRGDRRPLEAFTLRFMVAALLTLVFFAFWPAEGPFSAYGFAPSDAQARYVEHLHGLRSGARTFVSCRDAEGLITCPSFHTTWAVLLALAFRHRRWLAVPMLLLNAAVILSTLTTGWHYLTDVLAGVLVAVIAVLGDRVLERWPWRVRRTRPE